MLPGQVRGPGFSVGQLQLLEAVENGTLSCGRHGAGGKDVLGRRRRRSGDVVVVGVIVPLPRSVPVDVRFFFVVVVVIVVCRHVDDVLVLVLLLVQGTLLTL